MSGTGAGRVGIYDEHWSTFGGGERFAAGIASALRDRWDVELLARERVEVAELAERLAVDLDGVTVRVVPPDRPLSDASADLELLVNASYRSDERNGARRGLFVVHFPHDPMVDVPQPYRRILDRVGERLPVRRAHAFVAGFHPATYTRAHRIVWSDGAGRLAVRVPASGPLVAALLIPPLVPREVGDGRLVVLDDAGVELVATTVPTEGTSRRSRRVRVPLDPDRRGGWQQLTIVSPAFVPDDLLHNGDRRRLGVPVAGVAVGTAVGDRARARMSAFDVYPPGLDFLDSYGAIASNSRYTRDWVARRWRRSSLLLYPPVTLRDPADKEPIILAVGRFFERREGHTKHQRELVEAFRMLHGRDPGRDWHLHVVGACRGDSNAEVDAVRAAAGLPVTVHVNAPGAVLADLYGRASVFWHAAGLGEDVDADPEYAEHFGIALVEAMSAGAVPVVVGTAGPAEICTDGIDGLWVETVDAFAERTAALLADPGRMRRMAAAARARAQAFGPTAFRDRLDAAVAAT